MGTGLGVYDELFIISISGSLPKKSTVASEIKSEILWEIGLPP